MLLSHDMSLLSEESAKQTCGCVLAGEQTKGAFRSSDVCKTPCCHLAAAPVQERARGYLDELLHLVLVFPAEDWSMSPPPTELAAPSEVERCSPNGLAPHMLSPPDAAWPAPGKSSSPEPPSFGPERAMPADTGPLD
jgi:hypothetical protein